MWPPRPVPGRWDCTRARRKAPGQRLAVLPSGELRLESLGMVAVGSAARRREIEAWALWGTSLRPEFLLLEPDGTLFARLRPFGATIPEAYATDAQSITALTPQLNRDYLQRVAGSLRRRFAEPLYVRNARIFDSVTGRVGAPQTVSVFRGRVASIRAEAPPAEATAILDAEGGTLIPGLFDAHVHITSGWSALLHIAAGVTSVRDMGSDNPTLLNLMQSIESGEQIGPRVLASGLIEGRSPFSVRNGVVVDKTDPALAAVRWYADHGYYGIKIYNSMPPDFVAPLAAEAHRLGLRVMGHVPAFMSSERAIRDGYDEITHINQLLLSLIINPEQDDTRTPFRFTALGERLGSLDLQSERVRRFIALMQARGIALDPPVAIFQQILLSRPGAVAPNDAGRLANMPADARAG